MVEAALSEVNYEVRLATGRKKKPEIVHVEKLKKFHFEESSTEG